MKKGTNETKTRLYRLVVSKLVYLEAMKMAEKHAVWWSRVKITETGDPISGTIHIQFRGRREDEDLIDGDIAYILEADERTKSLYEHGKANS